MKRFKKITAVLLTAALLLGLAACGGPTYDEELLGVYTCYAVEMMGYEMSADEVLSEESTVELKQGGKGNMSVEGESDSMKYTLDGENITIEIEGETAVGTLKDGILDIEIMELHMFFVQEGREIPVNTPAEVGYYAFHSAQIDGESFTAEDLEGMNTDNYLQLNEDNTGCLCLDGEIQNFTWGDGLLTAEGESMTYTLDGDMITISAEGLEMTFIRSEGNTSTAAGEAPVASNNTGAGDALPVSLDIGDYHIEVVGADQYTDEDGQTAIRIYMDFTNNNDFRYSFLGALYCDAFQDGYELVDAYADYDLPESNTHSQSILPGCTVRVTQEFVFKPDGGVVEFKLYEYSVNEALVVTIDPANLPGAPADTFSFTPCDSSVLVEGLSASGTFGDAYDVTIRDLELAKSWTGEDMVRIFIDFTNNGEEATSLWDLTSVTVMQDGVTLVSGFTEKDIDTDNNYSADVEPGESITISMCYKIHDTGSPIAFLLEGFAVTGEVGTVLELP